MKSASAIAIAGLLIASTALILVLSAPPEDHLELSVASTHEEGAWLQVESAYGYTWNNTERSHESQRFNIKGDGAYVQGEFIWVPATCGTGNIYTVTHGDYFVTAISFSTSPCPGTILSILEANTQ